MHPSDLRGPFQLIIDFSQVSENRLLLPDQLASARVAQASRVVLVARVERGKQILHTSDKVSISVKRKVPNMLCLSVARLVRADSDVQAKHANALSVDRMLHC